MSSPLPTYYRAEFKSTWKTDNVGVSNDNQIVLPLEISGTYNFKVSWGDENTDKITIYNQSEVTHTYASAGIYTVKIIGTINGWRFNNVGDKLKLLTIESWGELLLGNNACNFYGCSNLIINAVDILDVSSNTTFYAIFRNCSSLTTFDVSSWDVSSITTFRDAFYGCSSLTTLDVSSWDVGSVTAMNSVFYGCVLLTDVVVNNWNITSTTNMTHMFFGVTLTTDRYDSILIAWAALAVQPNVNFNAGNSKYTGGGAAATARAVLTSAPNNWIITDGGIA
ncbi:MAG: BspA family leucine-rich repeat surface protein [Candidatus Cloacimonetes bacterium]|nr:BspA family leucine-rich repeat surface protein [Candidatus Cloacimonadota bacterium]